MPFYTQPIAEAKLHTLAEVKDWISDTQRGLSRISVDGVLEHGAIFRDDEYLGEGDTLLHFNKPGFHALCQRLGCRQELLERLESPSLASQVLNDLLAQRDIRLALRNDEFVMDERTGAIIGLVSKTYVTYSNHDLLNDITSRIGDLPEDDAFVFQEAYGINTALTLRYVATQKHGTIKGRGGEGEDKSKLGLEFGNSMVGNSSVRINYYIHRLICANGLMVPAAESVNRVFHSGKTDSFQRRMDCCFDSVMRGLGQMDGLLKTLGSMPFEPEQLAIHRTFTEQIFGVIPCSKQELCEQEELFLRYPQDTTAAEREMMRREHDARLIGLIPKHFGGEHSKRVFTSHYRDGATLFDLINVFTEHAKTQPPSRKLEIEEKAGALAKYLANNSKKL
jgi:hypothetical protein